MNNIEKAIKNSGLSQKQIAISLKVSQPTVSDWKNGNLKPNGENLVNLARLLNVSTDFLLGKSSDMEQGDNQSEVLDDMSYALMREARELTDEEKQQLIDMAQFLRSRRK